VDATDRTRKKPLTRHREHHINKDAPIEDCWQCGRDRARCRSKLSFDTVAAADAAVSEVNSRRGYAAGVCVTRYPCTWCPNWHMKTARTPIELARVEKARRRELVRERMSQLPGYAAR